MEMAFAFMFMLGAGMLAAFLMGARAARPVPGGGVSVPTPGPSTGSRLDSRTGTVADRAITEQSTISFEAGSAPTCDVNFTAGTSAVFVGKPASPAAEGARGSAQQAPPGGLQQSPDEEAMPASTDSSRPAAENMAAVNSSAAAEADLGSSRRAADAALQAAAYRHGLDGREESAAVSLFINARKHPRGSFRGTALATIYPHESRRNKGPIQCVVLTRDLSCSGIGIAHSEQLYPKQIVVLEAVGKLLVGEVRWCRRVDESFYVAGCRLVKTTA